MASRYSSAAFSGFPASRYAPARPNRTTGSSGIRSATSLNSAMRSASAMRGIVLVAEVILRCGARGSEATLGLGIQGRRERPLQQGVDIILEMRRVDRPHDARGHVRVGEGEAEDELHRGHPLEHVIESCLLPALPLRTCLSAPGGGPLGSTAPDGNARSRVGCGGTDRIVSPLHRAARY